jgi:hypothetical protein
LVRYRIEEGFESLVRYNVLWHIVETFFILMEVPGGGDLDWGYVAGYRLSAECADQWIRQNRESLQRLVN